MRFKNILLVFAGFFTGLLIAELILRITIPASWLLPYNKDLFSVKDRVSLYYNVKGEQNYSPKLDPVIIHTKNKLGLRGPNLTDSNKLLIKILCVGGSTTECEYLTDGKDWPTLLGRKFDAAHPQKYWLNNAGIDGHSTFGHITLLENSVDSIKPAFIFFLVGCNDIGRADLSNYDINQPGKAFFFLRSPAFLFEHSYIIKLLEKVRYEMFQKRLRAKYNIQHQSINFTASGSLEVSHEESAKIMQEHKAAYIPEYGSRLQKIITLCRQKGIQPILITQPTLAGTPRDPTTGVDMNKIFFSDSINGATYWELLELYNDETRNIALKNNVPFIDLAREMPKDSKSFYDFIHYTNTGAQVVSQIIFDETENRKLLYPVN